MLMAAKQPHQTTRPKHPYSSSPPLDVTVRLNCNSISMTQLLTGPAVVTVLKTGFYRPNTPYLILMTDCWFETFISWEPTFEDILFSDNLELVFLIDILFSIVQINLCPVCRLLTCQPAVFYSAEYIAGAQECYGNVTQPVVSYETRMVHSEDFRC